MTIRTRPEKDREISVAKLKEILGCPRCFWRTARIDMGVGDDVPPIAHRKTRPQEPYHHFFEGNTPLILADQHCIDRLRSRKGISVFNVLNVKPRVLLTGRFEDCLFDPKRSIYVPLIIRISGKLHAPNLFDQLEADCFAHLLNMSGFKVGEAAIFHQYCPEKEEWMRARKTIRIPVNPKNARLAFEKAALILSLPKPPKALSGCEECAYMKTASKFER